MLNGLFIAQFGDGDHQSVFPFIIGIVEQTDQSVEHCFIAYFCHQCLDGIHVLAVIQFAMPATSPPPPMAISTVSVSAACLRISSPTVPCPAMTS